MKVRHRINRAKDTEENKSKKKGGCYYALSQGEREETTSFSFNEFVFISCRKISNRFSMLGMKNRVNGLKDEKKKQAAALRSYSFLRILSQ